MDFKKVYNQIKEIDLRESASININADNVAEIEMLMKLFSNAGVAPPPEMSMPPKLTGRMAISAPVSGPPSAGGKSPCDMAKKLGSMEQEHKGLEEKFRAPKSGEFQSYVDTPEEDDVEVTVHWEADEDGAGRTGVSFHAVDTSGNEVEVSSSDEMRFQQELQDEMQGQADDYGDYKYQQRKDSALDDNYDNEPDEEYQDNDYMQHDLAGGAGRKKKMYPAADPGDNPMSVGEELRAMNKKQVETIKSQLYAALTEKKGQKPDFLDADKDGDKKEPMKKALKDKKKKTTEAKDREELEKATSDYVKKGGTVKKGKTKKAKGSTPRMPGSYHLGKTGSADADVKTKEGYSGTGKTSRPGDHFNAKQKVGKSSPSHGPEQKNVTKGKLVGDSKITNKKAISVSKEVNDIVALATRVAGNKAVAKQTGAMMNLKKLAGI